MAKGKKKKKVVENEGEEESDLEFDTTSKKDM